MNNVRRRADAFNQTKRRVIEKSEAFVIFRVTVNRIAVKIFRRVNQKVGEPVCFRIKRPRPVIRAAPIDRQIVNRQMTEIFALGLPVTRRNQHAVRTDFFERLGSAPATSPKPPVFEMELLPQKNRNTPYLIKRKS
jgi:hypothetical protein